MPLTDDAVVLARTYKLTSKTRLSFGDPKSRATITGRARAALNSLIAEGYLARDIRIKGHESYTGTATTPDLATIAEERGLLGQIPATWVAFEKNKDKDK